MQKLMLLISYIAQARVTRIVLVTWFLSVQFSDEYSWTRGQLRSLRHSFADAVNNWNDGLDFGDLTKYKVAKIDDSEELEPRTK